MSMTLTSIGASSSRIQATAHRGTLRAIPLHPRSSAFHTTSAPRDEAAAKKKKQGWTVQEVDGQLATMRRQQAQLKKAGQIDMYTFNVPIMDRVAEPPAQISYLFKSGGFKWFRERITRFRQDRHFLNEMIKSNAFAKRKGASLTSSVYQSLMCLRPTYKAGNLVADLRKVWERYHLAQARGDESTLREVSVSAALESARKLARSNLNMQWEVKQWNAEPVLLSARVAPIDLDGTVSAAQVVLRFDTTQVLTVTTKGERKTKEQRVLENWVFERHLPARTGWRIKERIETTAPLYITQ